MKFPMLLRSLVAVSLFSAAQSLLAQETVRTFFFESEIKASEAGRSNSADGPSSAAVNSALSVGNTLSGFLVVDFSRIDLDASPSLGFYPSAPGDTRDASTTQYTPYQELNFVELGDQSLLPNAFTLTPRISADGFSSRYTSELRVEDNLAEAISGSEIEVLPGGTYGANVSGPTLGTPEGDSLSFGARNSIITRSGSNNSSVEILFSSLDEITLIGDQLSPENFDLSLFDDANLLYYSYRNANLFGPPNTSEWTVAEAKVTSLTLLPIPEPSIFLLTLLSVSGFLFKRRR